MERLAHLAVAHAPPLDADSRPAVLFVVAIDRSPAARQACATAATLARMFGGALVLVHVLVPTDPGTFASVTTTQRMFHADIRDAKRLLAETETAAADVVLRSELRFGDPSAAICQAARDLEADLIVVGSRALSRFDRIVLGSVSRGVVQRAGCSVLVVRGDPSAAPVERVARR